MRRGVKTTQSMYHALRTDTHSGVIEMPVGLEWDK